MRSSLLIDRQTCTGLVIGFRCLPSNYSTLKSIFAEKKSFKVTRTTTKVKESGQIQLREQNSSLLPNSIRVTRNTGEMQSFLMLKTSKSLLLTQTAEWPALDAPDDVLRRKRHLIKLKFCLH